jgi:hypothetical protein
MRINIHEGPLGKRNWFEIGGMYVIESHIYAIEIRRILLLKY